MASNKITFDGPWDAPPPSSVKPTTIHDGWQPDMNTVQREVFDSPAKFTLAYGPRASGKTFGCLHALVRHAYETRKALAIIITLAIRVGKKGVLYDLQDSVLPAWAEGNKYPEWQDGLPHPKAGQLMDNGLNLQYAEARQDADTKDLILWIRNRFDEWSQVMIISIPYAAAVKPRMKGMSPSFIYLEEVTDCPSEEYFVDTAAQLNRRREAGLQQWYGSCNPSGPSSWTYKTFWTNCIDEKTGERDPGFNVIHVPVTENIHRLPAEHVKHLEQVYKDPIERRRMIDGEWIDRPSGDAIFRPYFAEDIHVVGSVLKGIKFKPVKGCPIIVGIDPGAVNCSLHFLQRLFIVKEAKFYWFVVDELNFVGTYTPYHIVVPKVLKRMDALNELGGCQFKYFFVAPDDAFNQVNTSGTYDATVIEKLGNKRIKLHACPRGKGSVVERVSMLTDLFLDDSIRISANCSKTLQMLRSMVSKKAKPGEHDSTIGLQPVKSVHLHSFDSLSYPLYYFALMPGRFPNQGLGQERESRVVFAGEGR